MGSVRGSSDGLPAEALANQIQGRSLRAQFEQASEHSKYIKFKVPVEMSRGEKAVFRSLKGFQNFGGRYRGEHLQLYGIFSPEHFVEDMKKLGEHFTDPQEISKQEFMKFLESDPRS